MYVLPMPILRWYPTTSISGNIVTLKRFAIKLTTILVGYPLIFRQLT